ncbi:MAG TPA: ATP-binding protein [Desulfobacteraceae bacterium]|nr:ATP-binding protein [Desulfobacteraceae bacterium]HPJ68414.1 ATP-binding protein [Desulfobacteraceae bacterium]HPQ29614.1 ATP-binding protein [Desulfobacteraceae bacterium]
MPRKQSVTEVPVEKLRWRLDQASLPFETTNDLEPLKEIIGQERGVEAFRFGMGIDKPGYNVFVTGMAGTGRMSTVKKLLKEMSKNDSVPDDLCYANNFENTEEPVLLRLKGGKGIQLKKDIIEVIETLKKDIPQLFESQEYISAKKEIMEVYEGKGKKFFKELDQKVKDEGFALVDIQMGQYKRPEVMPIIDEKPMHIDQVEEMAEKGRFPKDEFETMKEKQNMLRSQIDQILLEIRDLQKEVQKKIEEMDRLTFMKNASDLTAPIQKKFKNKSVTNYINSMLEDMADNLEIFRPQQQSSAAGIFPVISEGGDAFQPYKINLLVDNSEQKGPPIIIEDYPTYRNIFGSIERVVDRSGVWRTDFSKIKAGSFIKANGGYLVINLLDAIIEPGVWQALKRALKSRKLEIQTYDPFYLFTTSGLKPEPIDMDVKVVVISNSHLYYLLYSWDEDVKKIFKVRADFDSLMDKNEKSIRQFAEFIKMKTDEDNLRPFDRSAVAALVEQAVRMSERQEKISTSFSGIIDLIRESDFWANEDKKPLIQENHVEKAIEAKIYRSNMIEKHIQEMIDRGTLMIDVDQKVVGQVNGLAVYQLGDYMFGKPSRITASTSMGRAGIVNIEREADMSGNTHNKGVLILGGYLRKKYAQDKPLTVSASIAFEQSYGSVDGDSASSTEIYALLSSLAGVPIKQAIAVTGSVNQKGEVQAIGGVNQKIEGFYDCCKAKGLSKENGVIIPDSNIKDLMLRKDVVQAVEKGNFHIYAVKNIDQGIEILTGKKAGELKADGTYPKGTINYLVDKKLSDLAEGLKNFGNNEKDKKEGNKRKSSGKKKV